LTEDVRSGLIERWQGDRDKEKN